MICFEYLNTFQTKYQSFVLFTLVWSGEKVEKGKIWKEKKSRERYGETDKKEKDGKRKERRER